MKERLEKIKENFFAHIAKHEDPDAVMARGDPMDGSEDGGAEGAG